MNPNDPMDAKIPEVKNGVDIKPLRTYEDDVKNAISKNGVTTTSMVLAEQAKRDTEKTKEILKPKADPVQKKNNLILILVVLLVAGGIATIYFSYDKIRPFISKVPFIRESLPEVTIETEKSTVVATKGKTSRQIISEIREIIKRKEYQNNDLVDLILTKEVAAETEQGTKTTIERLDANNIFTLLDSRAPDSLIRSLKSEVIVGLHKKDKLEPFILFKSNDLNQTYAGMLVWERNMVQDLRDIFFENLSSSQVFREENLEIKNINSKDPAELTSNIIGVEQIPKYDPIIFNDLIISNKDVRAITNTTGDILFFYSILDNENIIITTNKETLDVILNRLNIAKLIR